MDVMAFLPGKLVFRRLRHQFLCVDFALNNIPLLSEQYFSFARFRLATAQFCFFALEQLPPAAFTKSRYIFNYGAKHTYFLRSQNVEFGLEITGAAGAIFRLSPFGNPIKYRFYRDKVFRSLEILDLSEKS